MSTLHLSSWTCAVVLVRNDFKEVEPRADKLFTHWLWVGGYRYRRYTAIQTTCHLEKTEEQLECSQQDMSKGCTPSSTLHPSPHLIPASECLINVSLYVCALLFVYMHISACVLYPVFIHCVLLGSAPSAYWGHVTNACVGRSKQGSVYWFYA